MGTNELSGLKLALGDASLRLLELARAHYPPVDVSSLCRAQGIRRVALREMSESASLVGGSDYRIYCNIAQRNPQRRRFSICHELAHTFFVADDERKETGLSVGAQGCAAVPLDVEERLCDWVAGALLMPEAMFRQAVARTTPGLRGLEELAKAFEVNHMPVLFRIRDLSLAWPCILVRWTPVHGYGRVEAFRLTQQWSFGLRSPLTKGLQATLDGLFRTYSHGGLATDEFADVRMESRRRSAARGSFEIESVLVKQ